ncbi:alpha/beta fold hydrolase [Stakelama tenebrarum]|uniref:Alpha/beta hydrolase n=1 Tax=Stakelama tenebrarum TaxID=2711215 RepID=A0A6G6Y2S4_9SPHN|nr:alpha/beta hydrolase [Sphingosinithalassobacter tenebrarum]QIG79107.1 alpha/beta hydrolase [Sphingosinithalassobacter tenebrarum]
MRMTTLIGVLALTLSVSPASAQTPDYGANLERFDYGWPVAWFDTRSQDANVRMAYLDVAPTAAANGETVVLLHGKNFCAGTWESTVGALASAGYRVIAPDQIGFCKSSKPGGYQYSFRTLANLTEKLLESADAGRVTLIGHSTGGMLAMHFALLHPERVERMVLVNPLGLNDTIAQGVPYADLGALRESEAKTDAESIRAYQQRIYYQGQWKPEYQRWVDMLAGQYASENGDIVREAQARLSDMIQSQPVAGQIPDILTPTLLIIGQADRTCFRCNAAPDDLRDGIDAVPQAAEIAAPRFPHAQLLRLDGLGHSPQVEAPARFEAILIEALATP